MAICRQACPYNTLDGCKVKEYGGFCQLTNTAQPITEYRMTNADRIRSMSDEELALWICGVYDSEEENGKFINGIIIPGYAPHDIEEWLQQPAEEDNHE